MPSNAITFMRALLSATATIHPNLPLFGAARGSQKVILFQCIFMACPWSLWPNRCTFPVPLRVGVSHGSSIPPSPNFPTKAALDGPTECNLCYLDFAVLTFQFQQYRTESRHRIDRFGGVEDEFMSHFTNIDFLFEGPKVCLLSLPLWLL